MWQLILGPLMGILGSGIEKFTEYKAEQLKMQARREEREHDLAAMRLESDLAEKRIRVDGEMKVQKMETKAFADSYDMMSDSLLPEGTKLTEKQISRILFVELFCKIIRPLSTTMYQIFLAVIFGWSAWQVATKGADFFTADEFKIMFREIVFSVVAMAEATLLWWYGIRRMSKKRNQA